MTHKKTVIDLIVALGFTNNYCSQFEQIIVVIQYNWHLLNNEGAHYAYYCCTTISIKIIIADTTFSSEQHN